MEPDLFQAKANKYWKKISVGQPVRGCLKKSWRDPENWIGTWSQIRTEGHQSIQRTGEPWLVCQTSYILGVAFLILLCNAMQLLSFWAGWSKFVCYQFKVNKATGHKTLYRPIWVKRQMECLVYSPIVFLFSMNNVLCVFATHMISLNWKQSAVNISNARCPSSLVGI